MARRKGGTRGWEPAKALKRFLVPYRVQGRWTTFNGAFQRALGVPDEFDKEKYAAALEVLGQRPDAPLSCVYCGREAATWDHLRAAISSGRFSGFGDRIFNLVPACRSCNERKGSKPWRKFLESRSPADLATRVERLAAFEARSEGERFGWDQIKAEFPEEAAEYDSLVEELKDLLKRTDIAARKVRDLVESRLDQKRARPALATK